MTDTTSRLSPEPLRFVWPSGARKRVARAFNVSIHTARDWLRDGLPLARRIEMARVVTAEIDRIEANIRRIRQDGDR